MSKTLVAYFSASDTTKAVAEKIAEEEKADIFAIVPEKPYTKEDLNWKDKQARSTVEMADPNCHPAMAEKTPDLSAYKTVILGFPIWWEESQVL